VLSNVGRANEPAAAPQPPKPGAEALEEPTIDPHALELAMRVTAEKQKRLQQAVDWLPHRCSYLISVNDLKAEADRIKEQLAFIKTVFPDSVAAQQPLQAKRAMLFYKGTADGPGLLQTLEGYRWVQALSCHKEHCQKFSARWYGGQDRFGSTEIFAHISHWDTNVIDLDYADFLKLLQRHCQSLEKLETENPAF
jgi:hypothetical protein